MRNRSRGLATVDRRHGLCDPRAGCVTVPQRFGGDARSGGCRITPFLQASTARPSRDGSRLVPARAHASGEYEGPMTCRGSCQRLPGARTSLGSICTRTSPCRRGIARAGSSYAGITCFAPRWRRTAFGYGTATVRPRRASVAHGPVPIEAQRHPGKEHVQRRDRSAVVHDVHGSSTRRECGSLRGSRAAAAALRGAVTRRPRCSHALLVGCASRAWPAPDADV